MQWYNNKYILNNKFSFRLLAICSKLRTGLTLSLDCVVLENENLSFFFQAKLFFCLEKFIICFTISGYLMHSLT